MKKLLLAALCLLLVPVAITQWASLYRYGELRSWMAGGSPQEILVGASWPFAQNQDGMAEGLLLAQEEFNARGVRGRRFRLVVRDDDLDRETSRNISIDFARNPRMMAVIGYYDDNFAVRASAIFEESRLLHIVIGANNTYMTSHGFRYLIRSVLASDLIARKLVRFCQARGYGKFAVIAEDGPFGEDLSYQFGAELDVLDAHLVYQSSYVRTQVDFRETVNELRAVDADVIVFLGLEAEAATFIKSARDMGLKTPIVGSFSDTFKMHEIAGKALEGAMFYEIYDADSPTPENRAFVAKFRKRFGSEPGAYAAQSYDALQLLARAVAITGSSDPLDLSYAIRFMGRWEGANGSYKFDDRGELEDKDLYLRMYRGGQAVTVATSPRDQTPIRR
jgi:branched-chain amino acid transport system substrate-binding protein